MCFICHKYVNIYFTEIYQVNPTRSSNADCLITFVISLFVGSFYYKLDYFNLETSRISFSNFL